MSYNERAAFQAEVQQVKNWWKVSVVHHSSSGLLACLLHRSQDSRFKKVKRPYTAEDVVSKRGTLPISYPSNVLAKKLFAQLTEHFVKGEPSHTYGA